jgi:membrane protein YqaA with SNARE-associated domain
LKGILGKITVALKAVSQCLIAYGPVGLFAIALLDSALIPLPAGPDAVMMVLSIDRSIPWVILLATTATAGSVIGCVALYYLSRRAGRGALARFSPAKQARVRRLIDRYDVFSIFTASILPPPFPFKLFVISAGVFRFGVLRFAIAVGVGRFVRFLLEGYLMARYGEAVKDILTTYSWRIGFGGVILAVLLAVILLTKGALRKRGLVAPIGADEISKA